MKTADAIRAIRLNAGLSTDEAAGVLGVSRELLVAVEEKRLATPVTLIEAVAAAFGEDPQAKAARESGVLNGMRPELRSASEAFLKHLETEAAKSHAEPVT